MRGWVKSRKPSLRSMRREWVWCVLHTSAQIAKLISQPFSTSRIVNLDVTLGPEIPDIERNGSCFTDGVGLGGSEVMREAARALGFLRGINSTPSAIQFRLGYGGPLRMKWPS